MSTKVLIVDDDGDVLEILGELLRHEGMQAYCTDSVEAGLELLESVKPDVVILDLVYQGSEAQGIGAVRTVKRRYPGLPVIVLSAIGREYALHFSREELAADAYVVKPPHTSSFVELIRRLSARAGEGSAP